MCTEFQKVNVKLDRIFRVARRLRKEMRKSLNNQEQDEFQVCQLILFNFHTYQSIDILMFVHFASNRLVL